MQSGKQGQRWEEAEEHTLSVAEAIREAMDTSQSPPSTIETLRDIPPPEPHLPLRKASAQRLQSRRSAPRPLWTSSEHQVRGFNPSPVEAMPRIANITASNEHAFAGRDESRRRPFKPPLGVQAIREGQEAGVTYAARPSSSQVDGSDQIPLSSPRSTPKRLRSSKSLGEGLRGLRHRLSSTNKDLPIDDHSSPNGVLHRHEIATEEVRDSFRSALTSNSSLLNTSSVNTGHSSLTGGSSHSDFVEIYPHWPDTGKIDTDMSVEDAIGMYANGFESSKQSMETQGKKSLQSRASFSEGRPSSQPTEQLQKANRPRIELHRRSQSASLLDRFQKYQGGGLAPPRPSSPIQSRTSTQIMNGRISHDSRPTRKASVHTAEAVPRDRYGFKKASHYITVEQYDAWNIRYSEHLERRRKKWHALMKSYGLNTDKPFRFPPKSDKIKRYVRKGIPPDLRGAAWFWYAGGPGKLAKEPGLYWQLVEKVDQGELSDNDREHIERDLNRTFPDNVRFKPDPTTTLDAQSGAGGGGGGGKKKSRHSTEPETPIVQALRRVLQAFAVHNPMIGYCQSLNFLAGLLLLFLDQDEEKVFILLNIVTTTHLPGTHGVALEGANIDIAVLMSCIKDSLPAIWAKLDDKGGGTAPFPSAQALRLPTVSLATTAWFMSLFVGTLPIESVLRVWDCLFFEGSKTLFRIALAIFKCGEKPILAVSDPMEIFQVVQTIPRGMVDVNGLMEVCFKRRGGFGHVSQDVIERRREERRVAVKEGVEGVEGERKGWGRKWRSRTRV